MTIRETKMVCRDEHVADKSELAYLLVWDESKVVENVYEEEHIRVTKWIDNVELVAYGVVLKDGQYWLSIVNRVPIKVPTQ